MGGIWKENWKRGAKQRSVSALEGHDLVRVEDLNGLPSLSPSTGSLIIGSGLEWITLGIGQAGFVLKSDGTTAGWDIDASGADGGIPDLSASGFVVGPASAIDRSVAIYDGTTGKLITDTLFTIDTGGNVNIGGNTIISGDLTVLGDISNTGLVINTVSSGTAITYNITDVYFNAITSATTGVVLPPSPVTGQRHIIKDIDGVAGTSPITVDGNGNTIDSLSTLVLSSDFESATLIFGPTEWNII